MFDKYKQRKQQVAEAVQKFEATHEKARKTHEHLSTHRGKYGFGVGIGVTVIVLRSRGISVPDMSVSPTAKNTMIGSYKSTQNIVQETFVVQAKGNPGDVVMRVSDGAKWASKSEMARDLGVARSVVTRYFNGDIPDIKGETFVDLGKAGHILAVPSAPTA